MQTLSKPQLPKALRPDDECTHEAEGFTAICSYIVHDYGTADDSADVELIAVELDFGGSKCLSANIGHFSNEWVRIFTDSCREHCDRQETLRCADIKAGVR